MVVVVLPGTWSPSLRYRWSLMRLVLRKTHTLTHIFLKHGGLRRLLVDSLTVEAVAGGAILRILPLLDAVVIHFCLLAQQQTQKRANITRLTLAFTRRSAVAQHSHLI